MVTVSDIERNTEHKMKEAEEILARELRGIRTGRASAALLDGVTVDYYGSKLPVNQVANINIPQPRLIEIKVWDENAVAPVEKAIISANIGMTPNTDGKTIRLNVPTLTSERRDNLIKRSGEVAEEFRVEIRNIRRDARNKIENLEKEGEISEDECYRSLERLQKITDKYVGLIDECLQKKEQEIREG